MIVRWWNQVHDWWQRDQLATELDEELRFHQDQLTREGAPSARRMGNLTRVREDAYETWSVRWIDETLSDFRHAARALRRTPGFAIAAALTLSLAIGVNTAVFSLANWVLLRPVPGIRAPGELIVAHFEAQYGLSNSHLNVQDLRAGVTTLSGLAAHSASGNFVPVGLLGRPPEFLGLGLVTANYFEVLGQPMSAGRSFTPEEEVAAASSPVAIISERLWTSGYGRASDVVGQLVTVSAMPARIVGVGPAGFAGTTLSGGVDVWLPGPAITVASTFRTPEIKVAENRAYPLYLELVGRRAPGASVEGVSAELLELQRALVQRYPEENKTWEARSLEISGDIGVPPKGRGEISRLLALLFGVAGIVLVIGCANAANFFLFRAIGRREELAVRRALGGSRLRLLRSEVAEGLVVAGAAGLLAVPVATFLTRLFVGASLPGTGTLTDVRMDWRVWAFAFGVALVAGIACGVLPGVGAGQGKTSLRLREVGARMAGAGNRVRAVLATLQLALALPLLVLTLLLVGTLRNLRHVDVGFDADKVTMFTIGPALADYSEARAVAVARDAVARLQALSGVVAASVTAGIPFTYALRSQVRSDALTPTDTVYANGVWIAGRYFETMGIELVAGRFFEESEELIKHDGEVPAILSERLAHLLFPTGNPVGSLFRQGRNRITIYRIVGVVRNSRWATLADEGIPLYYEPARPSLVRSAVTIAVRSPLPAAELDPPIRAAMATLAPDLALFELMRLTDRIERFLGPQRLLARMLTMLGGIAATLAGVGLYSVMAFWTAERRKEIGIRIALGAASRSIVTMVLRQAGRLAVLGMTIGAIGSFAGARLVSSRLFGVSAQDPLVYVISIAAMLGVVLLGAVVPARSASRADSMIALRTD